MSSAVTPAVRSGRQEAEYQINSRLSFQRFLGLGLGHKVLDAAMICLLHVERLGPSGCEALLGAFGAKSDQSG